MYLKSAVDGASGEESTGSDALVMDFSDEPNATSSPNVPDTSSIKVADVVADAIVDEPDLPPMVHEGLVDAVTAAVVGGDGGPSEDRVLIWASREEVQQLEEQRAAKRARNE